MKTKHLVLSVLAILLGLIVWNINNEILAFLYGTAIFLVALCVIVFLIYLIENIVKNWDKKIKDWKFKL